MAANLPAATNGTAPPSEEETQRLLLADYQQITGDQIQPNILNDLLGLQPVDDDAHDQQLEGAANIVAAMQPPDELFISKIRKSPAAKDGYAQFRYDDHIGGIQTWYFNADMLKTSLTSRFPDCGTVWFRYSAVSSECEPCKCQKEYFSRRKCYRCHRQDTQGPFDITLSPPSPGALILFGYYKCVRKDDPIGPETQQSLIEAYIEANSDSDMDDDEALALLERAQEVMALRQCGPSDFDKTINVIRIMLKINLHTGPYNSALKQGYVLGDPVVEESMAAIQRLAEGYKYAVMRAPKMDILVDAIAIATSHLPDHNPSPGWISKFIDGATFFASMPLGLRRAEIGPIELANVKHPINPIDNQPWHRLVDPVLWVCVLQWYLWKFFGNVLYLFPKIDADGNPLTGIEGMMTPSEETERRHTFLMWACICLFDFCGGVSAAVLSIVQNAGRWASSTAFSGYVEQQMNSVKVLKQNLSDVDSNSDTSKFDDPDKRRAVDEPSWEDSSGSDSDAMLEEDWDLEEEEETSLTLRKKAIRSDANEAVSLTPMLNPYIKYKLPLPEIPYADHFPCIEDWKRHQHVVFGLSKLPCFRSNKSHHYYKDRCAFYGRSPPQTSSQALQEFGEGSFLSF
ncbi:hypothetical protein BDR26DRAFT_896097 [Obelidium mucronatum]|nr:hypothetical protein BDR26DRAFT_896097 [Obelidium mucronatum]